MTIEEEKYYVYRAMLSEGGSFVKGLGEALLHADPVNTRRIKAAFPGYWKEYYQIGIQKFK